MFPPPPPPPPTGSSMAPPPPPLISAAGHSAKDSSSSSSQPAQQSKPLSESTTFPTETHPVPMADSKTFQTFREFQERGKSLSMPTPGTSSSSSGFVASFSG